MNTSPHGQDMSTYDILDVKKHGICDVSRKITSCIPQFTFANKNPLSENTNSPTGTRAFKIIEIDILSYHLLQGVLNK